MSATSIISRLLKIPTYAEELDIDLSAPEGRFKWFLAALLFGKPISEKAAIKTYREFEGAGVTRSPDSIIRAGWDRLVELLDAGGYVRYDFSTATKLLNIMADLKQKYGDLEGLRRQSVDEADLENRLQEFKGIGPTTTQIFLRELRAVWNVTPALSPYARHCADSLGIDLDRLKGDQLSRVETALVKLYLHYCKRRKCRDCDMADCCRQALDR